MIVCLCRSVSDRRIKEIIDQGARTFSSVRNACEAGSGCGACVSFVKQLLDEKTGLHREESYVTKPPLKKECRYGRTFK